MQTKWKGYPVGIWWGLGGVKDEATYRIISIKAAGLFWIFFGRDFDEKRAIPDAGHTKKAHI
ncbi:MAG TPA: hypothetical protein VMW25_02145 [Clostridia bacterium]|nr:hypothetical protein [Clostridia bacterium]